MNGRRPAASTHDLVVISLERWDGVWRRNQHLVSRLLRGDPGLRVLFVEPPDDPLHALRSGRRPSFGRRLRARDDVQPRLFTLRPLKLLPRRFDPGAEARPVRTVTRAVHRLGMRDPILWVNDPAAAPVARATGWPTLYDITDDWAVADRPARERARIVAGEDDLLRHAAEVVACSPELVRRKQPRRATGRAPVRLVRNAVDVAAYRAPTARPAALPDGRTAVYVGTLHEDRLDVDLCLATARAVRGQGTVVLVGPNALSDAATHALQGAGVVLLGAQPHTAVPAFLQHADVLLVPHRVDAFTDSLDPIKLYEYQAVGRPVVATPVAGFRDAADPRVQVADAAAFPAVVVERLRAPHGGTALAVPVSIADWSERAAHVAGLLADVRSADPWSDV